MGSEREMIDIVMATILLDDTFRTKVLTANKRLREGAKISELGPRRNYHEGRAAIRHYANQPARPL